MKKLDTLGLRTWIEIDKKAIEENYRTFRALISEKTKLMAVVKSNAYGHELISFAKEMEKLGADFLGVDSAVEARTIRKEGITTPILVLGYTLPELLDEMAELNVSVTISSMPQLERVLARTGKALSIHIKVDTGMHRQGFQLTDLPLVLEKLLAPPANLRAGTSYKLPASLGLYTHFASAKNPAFPADTKAQIAEFEKWRGAFMEKGLTPICHASATAGAMLFPESHFDMVRIGIGLYGLPPARETESYYTQKGITLKPVLSWRTIVSEVKTVTKGERIGYDFTEHTDKDIKIAVLPIGYWHGLPRALSSIGHVLIGGQKARIVGRISMDMIVVDVTNIKNVSEGDIATLIGNDGAEFLTAFNISTIIDMSWYELITRLNPLIKRIYI